MWGGARRTPLCGNLRAEQRISHGGWIHGRCVGRDFYNLYNLPAVIRILGLIIGADISNIGSTALRRKLRGNVKTSYLGYQDRQCIDQSTIGNKRKHTVHLRMVTVRCRWWRRALKLVAAG